MPNPIIRVNKLCKRYRIGLKKQGYQTFREAIIDTVTAPAKNLKRLNRLTNFNDISEKKSADDMIWALRDASFEVNEGEVLGIIGKNGVGKSTLLKILSRITEPTSGFAEINGRVSSLLEVGTGFHPELTGRENIFLNGSILGMRKQEIKDKFDEIVSFSEIEKYLDTPVKRFSSGMGVRLAFAVAAHLEPEIMLIDEVLAVGDIAFQEKCLGKMKNVAKGGRTVLFVSHNMGAIRSLCSSAIWLDSGQIVKMGPADKVVRDYEEAQLKHFDESSYIVERDPEDVKNSRFHFSRVEMLNEKGEHTNTFKYNEKLILIVDFAGELSEGHFCPEFYIYNELGQLVSVGSSGVLHNIYFNEKVRKVRIEIGPLILTSGKYRVTLSVMTGNARVDTWENAIGFTIIECQPFATNWEMPLFRDGVCVLQHFFS